MAASPPSPLVSVDEYLSTSYDPDVEYVDGVLVERNMGDWLHSLIQSNILFALRRKFPHLKVIPELRTSVADARFRLPHEVVGERMVTEDQQIWLSRDGVFAD
jgi:Uma2 family endonuclease